MLLNYSFTKQINKFKLITDITELMQLNDSNVICMDTGTKTPQTKVAVDYDEFDYETDDDFKAMVNIYLQNDDTGYLLYEFNFGIKLAKKINVDLYTSAPFSSPYDTIQITPNGSIYNCTEEIYEDKNGEEFIKIENLQKLSHIKIQNLKKEFIKATLKERIGQDESIDRQDKAC